MSGPIPNWPKFPAPHAKRIAPGLCFWGGTGKGLKYGLSCGGGAGRASGTGESFLGSFFVGDWGLVVTLFERGLREGGGAAGGTFSDLDGSVRVRLSGGEAARSGEWARLLEDALLRDLGAGGSSIFDFDGGFVEAAREERRGGMRKERTEYNQTTTKETSKNQST